MIRKLNLLTLIFLSFTGCHSLDEKATVEKIDSTYVVDIVSCIDQKSEIKISDIASEVTYIPLETNENNTIGNILKVICTENFIFVCDVNGLYQFTPNGKFLRQIGSLGRGPGEHSSIMNFAVSEKANIVIVQGESSTVKYDLEGNYARNLNRLPGFKFEFLDSERIVFYKSNSTVNPVNLLITSLDMEIIRKFHNMSPRSANNTFSLLFAPLYRFNDNVYFKENFNDTLFCLRDSILVPHIIINEKDLLLDKNFEIKPHANLSELISQLDLVEDKLLTSSIFESERFVFISYTQGMNPRTPGVVRFIFDKENNNTFCINNGEFINDIDGGMDFYPQLIADSKVLIKWIDVLDFKAHIASATFLGSVPNNPSRKKELETLNRILKEDDNPVLMLVKLKE